jgi:hypothetical protein
MFNNLEIFANRIFTRLLTSKLKAWGCASLAVSVAVIFIFNITNPGQGAANWLCKHDSKPSSKDLEVIVY